MFVRIRKMKISSVFFDILFFMEVLLLKTTIETELMECNLLYEEDNYVDELFEEFLDNGLNVIVNKIF